MDKKNSHQLSRTLLSRLFRVTWNTKLQVHRKMLASDHDITPEQMMVMGILWRQEGVSQTEICNFIGKSKSNVTRTLDRLSKRGWVYRKTDPNDRRSYQIFLTDSGRDLQEELYPILDNILSVAFRDFSEEEFAIFQRMLDKITKNLKEIDELSL